MQRSVRNLQTTLILIIVGVTLNAQPVPFTEVPSNSTNFLTAGDYVYFTSGDALWRTDGTAAGTFLLKSGFTRAHEYYSDIIRDEQDGFTAEFKGQFFFVSAESSQLWRSDGTPSGTILLKTSSSENVRILTSTQDYLFFIASDAAMGQELYRTDGTAAGTIVVRDINPGSANGFYGVAAAVGNELFFGANDGVHGNEPWKTTGTSAGTVMITDLNPGSASGFGASTPMGWNGMFFFVGTTAETGTNPWVTDGTAEGTYILSDETGTEWEYQRAADYKIVHDGYMYFVVREMEAGGSMGQLWRTDGTAANTSFIKEVGLAENAEAVGHFRIYKDKIFFWNNYDPVYGYLWVSDGTTEGTHTIHQTSIIDGALTFFEVIGDYLLFTGHSSGYPHDLYRSDGTEEGTDLFVERKAGTWHRRDITGDITKVGDLAFYADHDGPSESKYERGAPYNEEDYFHIFQTDAETAESMRTIFGVSTTGASDIADFSGKVLFSTYDDWPDATTAGKQLWTYDPSAPANTGAGKLSVETWIGISGTQVSAIPVDTPPSSTSEINIFETPKNIGDNYGSRVRGYVIPPTTGNYNFWIASDDRSELWLSTDDSPANKRRIADVAGWTNARQWDKYTSQKSAPISLVAGRKYYVEALLKEGTGADHVAVGWQLPDGTLERPIPANRLMAFNASADTSPKVAISYPRDGQSFTAPADFVIHAEAYDTEGSIAKVEFYNGTAKLGEDATSPYSFAWNDVPAGNYTIVAKAIDNDGETDSHSIVIYVTDPAVCAGKGMIRQEFWTNVTGTRVSDIPVNEEPDFTQDLTVFEGPASPVGDNYGSRIRGYICPPSVGEYIFWISGDDQVELWLSTDDDPANKRRIAYHTGWTQKREWDRYPTQQSAPITLEPGRRYYIEALMKEGSGGDHVSVGWQFPSGFVQRPIIGNYLIPFGPSEPPPTACAGTGSISAETWTGIDGTQVSSIPVNTSPNLTGERNIFEAPTNIGNNFGSRFRGYVCVPASGNYTFWIASDDHSELWLSTDKDPANKRRIAYHTGWTSPRQWTKYATQQSAPVSLVAGQQYYIEALYKEDEGGDNMAVGWQLPDGTMERPIPGSRLSPFEAESATMASQSISSEQKLYEQISVYPNPAKSGDPELTISGYEGIEETIETQVQIINMTGDVVFEERISCGGNCGSYLLDVDKQLVPGVYLVNMKTNGVRTSKRLLVK